MPAPHPCNQSTKNKKRNYPQVFRLVAPPNVGDTMPRGMVKIASSDWAVHFIAPDGKTRIGPWLLRESHEAVLETLRWGNISKEELEAHKADIRFWGCSSVHLELTDAQYAALLERGRRWPWNGYELRKMKAAGKYPPAQLPSKARRAR